MEEVVITDLVPEEYLRELHGVRRHMMRSDFSFRECYIIAECIRDDGYEIAQLAHEIWVEWNTDGVSEFRNQVIGEILDVACCVDADPVAAGIARRMIESVV